MSTALEHIRDEYDKRVAETDVPDEGEASDRNGDERQFCDGCSELRVTVNTSFGELCDECLKSVVEPEEPQPLAGPARTPKQIAVSATSGNTIVAALLDDGSIWILNTAAEVQQWLRLPSLPV